MNECKYCENNTTFENAYEDCQIIADGIVDAKTFQNADFGLVMYHINNILKALEKQVKKKPIEQSTNEKTHYKCKCGYIFCTTYKDGYRMGNQPMYCEKCGQKTDWSKFKN